MRAYIATNKDGTTWLFSAPPVRRKTALGETWCIDNGCSLLLSSTVTCERHVLLNGDVFYDTWLHKLGLASNKGLLRQSRTEPIAISIDITIDQL